MDLVKYVPKRDLLGRFKPSKKKLVKVAFVFLALVSFYTNYTLAKEIWNLRCEVNGKVVGWFIKDITCGELAETRMELIELDRQVRNFKEARAYENE